jgi:uncharacterized protein (TIGR03000 family)
MYGMVVLMALTTTVDTPDLGCRRGGRRGCRGVSNSCCGNYGYSSCGGCYGGGYGGCYGGYSGGCYGGYSGCYGYSGPGGYYAPGAPYGMPGAPGYGTPPKSDGKKDGKKDEKKKVGEETSAPATFVVNLPENARLLVDDYVTKSTSVRRVFVSPPLEQGKTFSYTLKAELMRDNGPVVISKTIQVQAGKRTSVTFQFPAAAVAAR